MTTTDAAIRLISKGSASAHKKVLDDMLDDASPWRPLGFEGSQKRRRDHLIGKGAVHVRTKLEKLYPRTHEKIEVLPFNFAKLSAATAASFYDEEPHRALVDAETGEELEDDDEKTEAFHEAIEQSRARVVLPKADLRAEWMGDAVIAVRVREQLDPVTGGLIPRGRLELHWGDHAWVLPDKGAPTDLQRSNGFVLKVKTTDANGRACDAFEVWTRAAGEGWKTSTLGTGGEVIVPEEDYKGKLLPFLMLHAEDLDALPFVERGDDEVDMVEMLVVGLSDEAHIGRMQGHTDRVYKGSRRKENEVQGGPDRTIQIDTGEDLTALSYSPALTELRTGNIGQMKTWALTKQHPLHSYTIEGQAPESGVAREVAERPLERMRRARDTLLVEKEEQELWPIVAEVWTIFVDPTRALTGVRFKVTPRRPKPYEDPEAKQRRLREDLDLGVISLARYAVEMGHYESIDDAVEAGIPDELKAAKQEQQALPGAPPLSRFAQRMQGREPPAPPEVEGEGEATGRPGVQAPDAKPDDVTRGRG